MSHVVICPHVGLHICIYFLLNVVRICWFACYLIVMSPELSTHLPLALNQEGKVP